MDLSDKDKERFWSKVDKTGECWLWAGQRNSQTGYGAFSLKAIKYGAHRISWLLAGNICPEGHVIRHKCRNRHCINPTHLETGTPAENARDMIRDGTSTRGTKSSSCKLTEAQVLEIFASNKSGPELAKEYGINRRTPGDIKSGKSWGWLTGQQK